MITDTSSAPSQPAYSQPLLHNYISSAQDVTVSHHFCLLLSTMTESSTSFAGLVAFFERGSSESAGQKLKQDAGRANRSDKEFIDQNLVEDIVDQMRERIPHIMERMFPSSRGTVGNQAVDHVAREVLKKEMMISLAAIFESQWERNASSSKSKEDQAVTKALHDRLRDMTSRAEDAEEALQEQINDKLIVQFTCDQYRDQIKKLSSMLSKANRENDSLSAKNSSLAKQVQGFETEIQQLREVANDKEVKALRAQHDSEMAHLIAKQATLQSQQFAKQLQESQRSSQCLNERVEELQRIQSEMRTLLENHPERSVGRDAKGQFGAQLESLVHKSSKALGRIGATISRRKTEQRVDAVEQVEEAQS